jgi:hypothetical protein
MNPYECSSSHSKVVSYAIGVLCCFLVRSSSALLASFLALLLPWPLVLQVLSFAIGRVGIDGLVKGKLGDVKA